MRFTELELELRKGPHELLASVLAAVELEPALRQARLSKFERGLIAMNWPLERRRTHPPDVDKSARWLDLGLGHLKVQLEQLRTYEPYAWEGLHVEGVHQMRIATRRARAALRAFAPALPRQEAERLAERLHWLADKLGAVRDLDVHQAKLGRDLGRTGFDDHPSASRYQRHLRRLHIRAHERLVEALASPQYRALIGEYRALLDAAVAPANASDLRIEDVASQTVRPLLDKVLAKGRALDGNASDRRLHKLRIKTKRLRYQLEFLRPAYGAALDPAIAAAHKLQSHLGTNQDARVGRGHLEAFRSSRVTSRHGHRVFKRLIERQHKRARRQRKRFAEDWQRMEAAAPGLTALL